MTSIYGIFADYLTPKMKYTKYLLKGDYINIEQFENKERPFYNVPLVIFSVPFIIVLFGGIVIMLPVTITFDNGRWLWYKWLLYDRRKHLSTNVQKVVTNTIIYRIIDNSINQLTHDINGKAKILSGGFASNDGRRIEKRIKGLHLVGTYGNRRSEMFRMWPKQMVSFPKRILRCACGW